MVVVVVVVVVLLVMMRASAKGPLFEIVSSVTNVV